MPLGDWKLHPQPLKLNLNDHIHLMSRKEAQVICLDSSDEDVPPVRPASKPVPTPQVSEAVQVKTMPSSELPVVQVVTAQNENYVLPNSSELADLISLMRTIKEKPLASDLKICITCWQLITCQEAELVHKKHFLTGTFAQMALCSHASFTTLC